MTNEVGTKSLLRRWRLYLLWNVQRNVNGAFSLCYRGWKPALLEDTYHGGILRQKIGNKLLQGFPFREQNEVTHQRRADTFALEFVDHGERDFGNSALHHDVP